MKYPTTIWHQPEQKSNSRYAPTDRPIEYIRKDMYDAICKALVNTEKKCCR